MSKKILIIEDDKILLKILARKLEHRGYEVATAESGKVGLDMVTSEHPDLILLDLVLPEKTGYEILDEMQKDERKNIPVIIISNSGEPIEMDRLLASGVRDYLVKASFDPEEVIAKVEVVFGITPTATPGAAPGMEIPIPDVSHAAPTRAVDILIIEDDQFLRDIMVRKLEQEKYSIEVAADGQQAIAALMNVVPKLVLLDLILPDFDGFEILIRMKKDSHMAEIPVIVLSNLGDKENMERARDLGATSYMIKAHYTPDEITKAIRDILGK